MKRRNRKQKFLQSKNSLLNTVHWRAGYEEKKFAAVIPVLSASNNVPKPKNIDFQIST